MKKMIFILIIIVFVVASVGFAYGTADTTEASIPTDETVEARHMETISWAENPWPSYDWVIKEYGTPQKVKTQLDIPVYYEEELLFNVNSGFTLNRDASFYNNLNSLPNDAGAILATYPTNAIRIRTDGTTYAVYDTDTGYRLYVFFESLGPDTTIGVTTGFPVVIKDMLSYRDFVGLNIGDDISKVEAIDEVATLHKKMLLDVWEQDYKGAAFFAEEGHPCTSIHYLTDGILKIEYRMLEDRSLVIADMIYNKDYQITNALEQAVNHKIEDVDLPIEQIN